MESNPELSDSNSAISIPKGGSGRSSQRSTNTDVESTTLTGMLINDNYVVLGSGQARMFLTEHLFSLKPGICLGMTGCVPTLEKQSDSLISESSSASSIPKRSSQRHTKTDEDSTILAGTLIDNYVVNLMFWPCPNVFNSPSL